MSSIELYGSTRLQMIHELALSAGKHKARCKEMHIILLQSTQLITSGNSSGSFISIWISSLWRPSYSHYEPMLHRNWWHILNFTSTLLVMSCQNNTCSVFAAPAYLYATPVCLGSRLCYHLKAKNIDMKTRFLSLDVTTKVIVKWGLVQRFVMDKSAVIKYYIINYYQKF